MITLKEYGVYLKVKKFIEAEGCEESSIIPKLYQINTEEKTKVCN